MLRKANKRKSRRAYGKHKQRGSFLNRYDFAYTGRGTVNQLGKIGPGIIKDASSQINNIT